MSGLPKLEIMPGYSIDDMARYRDEQPEAFDAYALRDAEIAALYASSIFDLLKSLGIPGSPPTLGAAGVAMFKRLFSKKEEWLAFLGQDTGPNSEKRRHWRPASHVASLMSFTAGCFHGGMNTIFCVGYSPPGRQVLDIDLARRLHDCARRDFMARLVQRALHEVARRPRCRRRGDDLRPGQI